MPIGTADGRIKFTRPAIFPAGASTGTLSIEVFGGPLARVSAAIFSAQDKLLFAVGFDEHGASLTTENGGKASWLFPLPPEAAYIKWSVQAFRSAGNLSNYSVTAKVRAPDGTALVSGQFDALIPDSQTADQPILDGADFVVPSASGPAITGGAQL